MFHDRDWFFTDEPTVMWGRQLEYVDGKDDPDYVVTPDRRRFTTLRRAFAFYRVGTGLRGPGDAQLEVMRRTMSWLHSGRYEQPIFKAGAKCPASSRHLKVDDRRAVCDIFGGSTALFEHYLLHLEMLGLATVIDRQDYVLTREGQAALIMLELTRPGSGIATHVGWLEFLHSYNRWPSVDPNQWASGIIVASDENDDASTD